MVVQLSLSKDDLAPSTDTGDGTETIARDLAYRRLSIVNVVFYGEPASAAGWTLIDTGLPTSASTIRACAQKRFGPRPPQAIIMTHGHFDHAGTVETLAEDWNVPVYAHPLELPFLNGTSSYPPPDPLAGGGAMALLSPLFPRSPVNLGARLRALPDDQTVPGMPGWRWLHTPGHAPGHISLWRESDRSLIAGDAFVTTGQESIYEVIAQTPEMHGPPRYFTPDWNAAEKSVRLLASLEPELAVTGHGRPVRGANMQARLHQLATEFQSIAVPPGRD
jgi:glyoxylase-like metal-dependent hydrolase (beta-lactamase superfamily II)